MKWSDFSVRKDVPSVEFILLKKNLILLTTNSETYQMWKHSKFGKVPNTLRYRIKVPNTESYQHRKAPTQKGTKHQMQKINVLQNSKEKLENPQ